MKKFIFCFSLIFLLASCQRENIDDFGGSSQVNMPNVIVESSVVGLVVDENGEGVENAEISLGSLSTITNQAGLFSFKDVQLSKNSAYIQVYKDGFFEGSRKFATELDGSANVRVQLIKKELIDIVEAQEGGLVTLDGSSIELPNGTYVNGNNNSYNGPVEVYAKWLDPTNPETFAQMPGELTGVDTEGNLNALATYGMLGVELLSEQGDYLNLPEGETATIKMEVPAELLNTAPNVIPLWHFNQASGNWEEEGEATLIGNEYVGEVSHFSFWNCDAPFPLVEISGYVTLNGNPMEGSLIKITDLSTGFCGYGYTGARGYFMGKVPEGQDLELSVEGPCGLPLDIISLGAFDEDTHVGIVSLDASLEEVIISGTFDNCIAEEIDLAYVIIGIGNTQLTITVNPDGSFYQSFPECAINEQAEIYGVDISNSLISDLHFETFEGNIELDLEACDGYVPTGIFVEYEGKNWSSNSDTFEFFIDPVIVNPSATPLEYVFSVLAIDWNIFFDDFVPVIEATFDYVEGEESANYFISFPSQGFSIVGQCEVILSNQAGMEIISLIDDWEGVPYIDDSALYPGEIDEVSFNFSFTN